MTIRVLTFDGCPNCDTTVSLVREVLGELGVQAAVEHIQLRDEVEAAEHHFLGSPSVQVDGKDIEEHRRGENSSFTCRLYFHEGRRVGVPPREMLVKAFQEARPR